MEKHFLGRGKVLASTAALALGLGFGYQSNAQNHEGHSAHSDTYTTTYTVKGNTGSTSPDTSATHEMTGFCGHMDHSTMKGDSTKHSQMHGNMHSQMHGNMQGSMHGQKQGNMQGNMHGSMHSRMNSQSDQSFNSTLDDQSSFDSQMGQEDDFANTEMYENAERFDDSTYDPFDSAYDDLDDVYEFDDPNVMYDYDQDGIAEFQGEMYGEDVDTTELDIVFDVNVPQDADVIGATDLGFETSSGTQSIAYGPYISPLALSDAEILHVFITMNNGEIATSEKVDDTASDWVREYAQEMVEAHRNVIQRAHEMDLEPAQNLLSSALETNSMGVANKLLALDGRELDNQYITTQLAMHQNALDMLDNTLIPLATSAELKSLLQDARNHVSKHLEEVRHLYHKLD